MNSALARIQLQQTLDKQVMDQAAQLWREMVKEKKDD